MFSGQSLIRYHQWNGTSRIWKPPLLFLVSFVHLVFSQDLLSDSYFSSLKGKKAYGVDKRIKVLNCHCSEKLALWTSFSSPCCSLYEQLNINNSILFLLLDAMNFLNVNISSSRAEPCIYLKKELVGALLPNIWTNGTYFILFYFFFFCGGWGNAPLEIICWLPINLQTIYFTGNSSLLTLEKHNIRVRNFHM
jgi:hypothetical protein